MTPHQKEVLSAFGLFLLAMGVLIGLLCWAYIELKKHRGY